MPNPLEPLRRLYRFYFPAVDFELPLAVQRSQAVNRLSDQVIPGWKALFSRLEHDAVGGKVSRDKLVLYRIEPIEGRPGTFKANSWRPMLFAGFRMRGDTLHLRGRFTIHPFVQAFTASWLLGVFAITAYVLFMAVFHEQMGIDESMPLSIPLMCGVLIVGGTLLVRKAWQWSEHDIDAISEFLEQTIGAARGP
ncbi:hypothetical protein [Wenzhouxiangella sp. EGI_FJ10409]|uniref:hypothetical protein n=1 Tax=Wenzhouxiangella sp. EGI_FJ10409 TaxID=3243767 RepID=UPI0035E32189